MQRIGELAAFGTAICWTISAVFFDTASRRIGTIAVNFYKVCVAFVLLTLVSTATRGLPFPIDASVRTWVWMSASGLVGFVIADFFLFNAYVMIGSRTAMLFLSLSPPISALLGFLTLGEVMPPIGLAGMALVCAGIAAAVLGRRSDPLVKNPKDGPPLVKGYIFAFLAAIGQSAGMILTKMGAANYDTVAGTQIRVLAGILGFGIFALISGNGRKVFVQAARDGAGMRGMAVGSVFGPFLGVTLSVFALQNTLTGTVSTLIGLTPVLILPPSILFLKQKASVWEILGAVLAVGGTVVFFL